MINLTTKFEISTFIHNEDTKNNAKCRNRGGLGWFQVSQGQQQHNHSTGCILLIRL